MKAKLALILLSVFSLFSSSVFSEPTSDFTTITQIRPYIGTNNVLLSTSSNAICGGASFYIDLSRLNGKAAYAAALAAMMANKRVQLEIETDKGCTGTWVEGWIELRSIYVLAQ